MRFLEDSDVPALETKAIHTVDVPHVDLSEVDDAKPTVGIRPVDEILDLEKMGAKLWYFEPGEEVGYHAHPEEEELYYVIKGEFSLKMGPADDPVYETVGPETFFAAGPYEPHGHRCVGDEEGIVLALGAPADAGDDVINPHEM